MKDRDKLSIFTLIQKSKLRLWLVGSIFSFGLFLVFCSNVQAQTATYHLHKESAFQGGPPLLKVEGPDTRAQAYTSVELKDQPAGEYLIKEFITAEGVPGLTGVIPGGSTVTFDIWMKKTANYGTMYPMAKLYTIHNMGDFYTIDSLLCTTTGSTPLTTTLTKYSLSCTTPSITTMVNSFGFYLWVGVNLTAGPGANRVKAELDIEGTLAGNYDSTVIAPLPVPPTVDNLTPTSGPVGTSVTITGSLLGDSQGSSILQFNGTPATPTSWSDTTIVAPVPAGVSLSPGLVRVKVQNKVFTNGLLFTVPLRPGYITAVAGNGSTFGGFQEGDPAPTVALTLEDFDGLAADGNGNLYFPNWGAYVCQLRTDGTLWRFAGKATEGYGGDGGPARDALLNSPKGVAVDSQGNVFIADTGNYRIRKVSPDGIITTVAGNGTSGYSGDGGPATSAQINGSYVAVDGQGNLLIGDSGNYRIRKVSPDGIITTVAGTGMVGYNGDGGLATNASLSELRGVAVDQYGNIFISDRGNRRIRKVSPNGIITTVAGNGINNYYGDGGPAINAAFAFPGPLAVDSEGNFYSSDWFWERVRKVGATAWIDSLSPASGPVGTSVTIIGMGFGSSQGTSTVTFNGVAAMPSSWSSTLIVAPVPADATTGPVVVTIEGAPGNGPSFTVTPQINSLSPVSGPAGTSVSISGTGFGATQGSSTVTFNGIAAVPTSWSATSIVVPAPAGATTGPMVVTVGGIASNGVSFTVAPQINGLSPVFGPIGSSVTISGTGFGASQGSSTVTFNGTAAVPTSWSATSIVVPVPAGATTGPVVVTVGGITSNGVSFSVTPGIDNLSATSGPVGASVMISGTNFGATQGSSTVTFNGTLAIPTSWSDPSIVVPVPADATTGLLVVTVDGIASNGMTFTVVPQIGSLSPTSGPVGTSVTISGTGFGATQGSSTVTFNGVAAAPASWSAASIVVPVPTGATSGLVVVTVGGTASNGMTFTVAPQISSLSPTSGPIGTSVTISGTSFGAAQGSSTVTFNGTPATPTSWSDTSVVVPVPAGATSGLVVVTVDGTAGNGMTFTVAPQISSISPDFGPAGTLVTISGTSFGATQGNSTVTFNGTLATPTSWSDTSIVVPVPSGVPTGPVVVTVGETASNSMSFTVTPQITSLSPTSGPVGASVVISGTGFGATQGSSTVTFNGTVATPTSWSDTSIVVPVPSGATTGPVVVTVGGIASNGMDFTVLSITITYPYPGAFLDQPDTVVMGRLAPGIGEVSVLVNGRPARVNGEDFAINAVELSQGQNIITATLTTLDGVVSEDSISVSTTAQDAYVRISTVIEETLAPMTARLEIDGVLPSLVMEATLEITGPSSASMTTTQFPFTATVVFSSPGIYLATVTVSTTNGSYVGRMTLNAVDSQAMQALLQQKWDAMKAAAVAGDLDGALTYFISKSQDRYRSIFTELQSSLASIFGSIETFHLLSVTNNEAEAEGIRTEDGILYSYPIFYGRDMSGFWKFGGF